MTAGIEPNAAEPVVFTGRIEYLSAKPRDVSPEGRPLGRTYVRLARLLLTAGGRENGFEPGGTVLVGFDFLPPPFVRRGAVVRARAAAAPAGVWRVAEPADVAPQCTLDDLEVLARVDLSISLPEETVLRKAFGAVRLAEVLNACLADREAFLSRAASAVGEERAQALAEAFARILSRADIARLYALMSDPLVGFDLPRVVAVYEFLKRRAALAGTTVTEMVKADPWVIAQVEDVDFRDADHLALVLGKEFSDPKRVVGAVMSVLQAAARNGDAYVPLGDAAVRAAGRLEAGNRRAAEVLDLEEDSEDGEEARPSGLSGTVKEVILEEIRKEAEWRSQKESGERRMPPEFIVRGKIRSAFLRRWSQEIVETLRAWQRANPGSGYAARRVEDKGGGIALGGVYVAEQWAAKRLAEFLRNPPVPVDVAGLRDAANEAARAACGAPLDVSQLDALYRAAGGKLTVICGPAGTGKTLLMGCLAAAFEEQGLKVAQLAATGAAAQRLEARSGRPCVTVHRAIAMDRGDADMALDPNEVPELRQKTVLAADVVVVDEATMLDVWVFWRLLDALPASGTRLILFGDDAQLGAVGPGMPFADLLRLAEDLGSACPGLKSARLETDHRNQSPGARNATLIRSGVPLPEAYPPRPGEGGFVIRRVPAPLVESALQRTLDEIAAEGVPPQDVLVLCRRKGGRAGRPGTEQLNLALQAKFNPNGAPVDPLGLSPLRVGDPVICIENDYPELRRGGVKDRPVVYNGTLGVVRGVSLAGDVEDAVDGARLVEVEYRAADGGRRICRYTLEETHRYLRLAYSLTVHKAQGAEAPVVVLVEYDPAAARLTRNLLYTAVTRAKQVPGKPWSGRVYLVGPESAQGDWVAAAVDNPQRPRYSLFYWRAKELLLGAGDRAGQQS
ncbi:MAG: AAA family ATPase [Moorellales bacterium]